MGKTLDSLAIFGGPPAFDSVRHIGRPNIGDRGRLLERINDLLDRRWLTNAGQYVQEFEQRLAAFMGVKHCVAMCNGTIALEIAIRAAGLTGEVIVPAFTFVATAHALQWQGITPVFCDIDPVSHCLDPRHVEAIITPRTTGIIGVHLWGRPCAIDELSEIAIRYRLKLLFDAAHAFGCSYKGRLIGGFGEAEVLSFHATKFFNTFEGGAVATNDSELARRIRLMKNFGFVGYDDVGYLGINGKMTEVAAAMGLTGLETIDDFIEANRLNYNRYKTELAELAGVRLISYDPKERCNYQYIVLEIDEAVTQLSRDRLVHVLHAENILARRYFYPGVHRLEPYRSYFPHAGLLLPETERVAKSVLSLPTGTGVSQEDICRICNVVRIAIDHGPEMTRRLMHGGAKIVNRNH
jgi:dTDP-4-amino-4,6-dideoxygalactose transaminase